MFNYVPTVPEFKRRAVVRKGSASSGSSYRSLFSTCRGDFPFPLKRSNLTTQEHPAQVEEITEEHGVLRKEVSERRVVPQAALNVTTSSVRDVQGVQDLRPEDIIVVVMGPTGAGKSTFIQKATNCSWSVGHSLQSHTNRVNAVRAEYSDGTRLVLVDTPGFDDTNKSDREILKIIASWFKEVRKYRDRDHNKLEIMGILYLHRITDNRMAGTPMKNLQLFQKLCGSNFFGRVYLTTTMWAPEAEENHWEQALTDRQAELEGTYWAPMLAEGARARKFRGTQESASEILRELVSDAKERRRTQILEIQQELVDLSKRLPATKAGQQLRCVIEDLVDKQTALLDRLRDEMNKTADPQVLQELITEFNGLRREREKAMKDMRRLDLSIWKWMKRLDLWVTRMVRRLERAGTA